MASLTSTPSQTRGGATVLFFAVGNPLDFTFSAGTTETSLQLQICNSGGTAQITLRNLRFDSNDSLTINLAPYLQTLLDNDDNTDNARGLTSVGDGTGKSYVFTLKYRANGTGAYSSIGSTYTAIDSARQIGSAFGATMAEYLPILSGSPPTVDATGQFMTLFERPTLWWYSDSVTPSADSEVSVWQLQLAFCLDSDDYTVIDCFRFRWYSAGVLSSTDEYDDAGTTQPVIAVPILEAEKAWQYDEVVVDVGIGTGSPLTMATVAIDAITVNVKRACNNPVAVKWLNSLGAWETWVFEGRTPRQLEVTSEFGEYGVPVRNVKTATETRRIYQKQAREAVGVQADLLTLSEVKALEEIATSPNVLIFVGALTGGTAFDDWQGVTVEATTVDTYDTYDPKHRIAFTFRLVDKYFVSN